MKVWNWEGFWSYFTNLYLLEGALWTIGLTVSTLVLRRPARLVLAVMRLSKHKAVSRTAQGYVWIFRGTPLLVQLIIIYTGLPQLGLVRFTRARIGGDRAGAERGRLSVGDPARRHPDRRQGADRGRPRAGAEAVLRSSAWSCCRRRCASSSAARQFGERALEDHVDRLGDLDGGGAAARPDPDAAEVPGARRSSWSWPSSTW